MDYFCQAPLGHVLVEGTRVHKVQRDPDAQSPAGGVSSSVSDVAQWLRLHLAHGQFNGRQMVDEKALAETHHPHMFTGFSPLTGLPSFYGLGMNVSYDQQGRLHLSHSGAFALGAATTIHMVPSEHLGIVVLTNAYPVGVAEGLSATVIDYALYGKPTQDRLALFKYMFSTPTAVGIKVGTDYAKPPTSPSPPLPNDAYIGTYTNDFFGGIAVIEHEGALALVEGPNTMRFALKHYGRDIFTDETAGENAVGTTGVYFTIGADGKARSVRVENLDVDNSGSFTRMVEGKQ